LVAGVTYVVGQEERTPLVTTRPSTDGPAHVTDLTGTLKDLAGPGPGGEFIRCSGGCRCASVVDEARLRSRARPRLELRVKSAEGPDRGVAAGPS
jgi:hypothetical protein